MIKPNNAAPWTTLISRIFEKSLNRYPMTRADKPIPTKNITYKRATTRGRLSFGALSLASANPAVWVICKPSPVIKNAKPARTSPAHKGPTVCSPDKMISAKGIIAKPPICQRDPNQINGIRFQPIAER